MVDLEFGRAVFRSPFAVEVQYQNDELVDAQKVAAVAPGRLDGFLDDGVVLDDTRDVDRCRRHVRILESFERRVYTWKNRKDAWFMVKTVAGHDRCCSRVEGTLQRSDSRAFVMDVLMELGNGIAVPAKERCYSLQNWTGWCFDQSSLVFVAGFEESMQFRLQTAIDTRKETRARY